MSHLGMMYLAHAAALAALMEPPQHRVIVIDNPPIEPDEVFAFYGNSTGAFRSSDLPRQPRPAIYKPNGEREVERRRRQREKREARALTAGHSTP